VERRGGSFWPPVSVATMSYRDRLGDVREFVRRHAVRAGLAADRVGDLVLAASEVAANTLRHTNGRGLIRIWSQLGELVCEFRDSGVMSDRDVGRVKPQDRASGGFGLWVVRQVCDGVDIESGITGTTIRLDMSLPA
jgi:anti-sigma regulatory factor (Ser/Thr protein kinase)